MSTYQPTPPDQSRIVALLAAQSQVPEDTVAKLYEHEHAQLAIGARITKFLHIFAIRHVQEILRKRRLDELVKPAAVGPPLVAQHLPMPPRTARSDRYAFAPKPLR